MTTAIKLARKKTNGTKIILLVVARKSAEASMTSIANLSDLNPQKMQQRNNKAITPTMIDPTKM